MKNIIKILIVIMLLMTLMTGCERSPLSVSFVEKSTAGGNSFSVTFGQEKLYEDKYVDILLKANEDQVTLKIGKEFEEKTEIALQSKDEWYSLTTLLCNSKNQQNTETFAIYKNKAPSTYLLETDKTLKLNIKCVAGDIEDNATNTGYLLSNKIDVSKIFVFEAKTTEKK